MDEEPTGEAAGWTLSEERLFEPDIAARSVASHLSGPSERFESRLWDKSTYSL